MNLPNLMRWTVAVAWGMFALHTNADQTTVGPEYRVGGFVLGCQGYMFHRFTAFEAIERTAAAGGRTIEFYPGQSLSPVDKQTKVDPNATDETIQKLKAKAKQHGLLIVNFGVVGIPKDEAGARKVLISRKSSARAPSPSSRPLIRSI